MRKLHATATTCALLMLSSAGPLAAAPSVRVDDVRVTNTAAEPIPVNGTVGVNGVVSIDSAPANPVFIRQGTPFQQRISVVNNQPGSEECATIEVPAGKTLMLESFTFELEGRNGEAATPEDAYILAIFGSGGFVFDRFGAGPTVNLPNPFGAGGLRGTYSYKLMVGGTTNILSRACAGGNSSLQGWVSGTLLD